MFDMSTCLSDTRFGGSLLRWWSPQLILGKKTPIIAETDVMQYDEQVLQLYCTASCSGDVNIFEGERNCHPVNGAAHGICSHYQS